MTEQSDKNSVVSGRLLSPEFLIHEQPTAGSNQPAQKHRNGRVSETPKPNVKPGLPSPSPQPGANMGRSLGKIVFILAVLLVLVNLPINFYGTGLAQIMPDASPVVIYDGLVLKGTGPAIYLLEDHKLRWVSSPEAFDHYFRRRDVRAVEDNLLEGFGKGQPIRRLVKCQDSPYIYALENGQKRRVKDPPTRNKANSWDEVHLVPCDYLRRLPDGLPIPEDAGPPP